MRLAFMGTPVFARAALDALAAAGHEIACVYTQPPRPAGRGQREVPSSVHARAIELGIPVRHPASLKPAEEQAAFAALNLDVAVVAAYGLLLPQAILDAPRLGCLNIHASLLPRWRGAAPIQRAIEAGDARTGITIMRMEAGLDTGPMLLKRSVPIGPDATGGTLHDELAAVGAQAIVEALSRIGSLVPEIQGAGATYARKLDKVEARLDWAQPAETLARRVRAFDPFPGAWFEQGGDRFKVLGARAVSGPAGAPGTVVAAPLVVACGSGALDILRVQRAGRAPMDADAFLRGRALPVGTVLVP
ncbi:MAG: methionyl-tRNA formyltransferase [Alphaproteobacteria bacterium]|nr:methionyl-tRNA formyltransferase [Alphaproteobacteria bacterium]